MSTTGLLNRLKAKLSSQQFSTKDIASLADRENEIKQKAINQSICDAVTAAVNSEEFTKAVAERLATELKPSLKNLDPSSYCAKLQLSTDKISQQFEAQDTKLTHLSTILETSNSSTAEKVTNIEVSISNITKAQEDLEKSFKSAEEKQKSQLDHLAVELATIQERITSEIETVPNKVATEIATIQEKFAAEFVTVHEKLVTINTSLLNQIESAKTDIVTAAATPFPELNKSLDLVLKTLDQNSLKLDEVNAKDLSSEVLTNIQDINKLQTLCSADLGSLKTSTETSINNTVKLISETENISSSLTATRNEINVVNTLLSDNKNSNITSDILAETKALNEAYARSTSLLEDIKSNQTELLPAVSASNSSHESHNKSLTDIKQTELEILESLKSVCTTISDQSQVLTDTKSLLNNELATAAELANTSASIEKLKTNLDCLGVSLNEVKISVENFKPITQDVDLSGLESSIQSVITTISQIKTVNESLSEKFDFNLIISSLEAQSNQISDVKSNVCDLASTNNKADLSLIDSSIKDLASKLEFQLTTLNELKASIKSQEDSHPSESTTS